AGPRPAPWAEGRALRGFAAGDAEEPPRLLRARGPRVRRRRPLPDPEGRGLLPRPPRPRPRGAGLAPARLHEGPGHPVGEVVPGRRPPDERGRVPYSPAAPQPAPLPPPPPPALRPR